MPDSRDEGLVERLQRLEALNRRWLLANAAALVIAVGASILAICVAFSIPRQQTQQVGQLAPEGKEAAEG